MKDDTITKLYAGLTDRERAALAFNYLTQENDMERKRIESAMPEQHFVGLPLEYRRTFSGILDIASLYGIEYWHLYSRSLEATVAMHIFEESNIMDKANSMHESQKIWKSRLLALDCALLAVCEAQGINADAVRRMAGSKQIFPIRTDIKPNSAYQTDMQINFARLLIV